MNFVKTTALLTLMTLVVLFSATAFGFDLVSALFFALIFNGFIYFFSGNLAIKSTRAQPIKEGQYIEVTQIISHLTQKEKMPMPELYIINSDQPNAFATGRNPKNAVVAATTGIMSVLDDNELEGVMAHEMAHVKNRDTLVMCVAATIAGFISFAARMMWWNSMFGGRNRNVHPGIMILVALTAPLAAFLLQMAVSRSREYHADETAAKLTNKPWALISALKKLEWENHRKPLDCGSPSNAAMCIVNPLRGGDFFINMFSTHPPMEKRIKELEKL